MGTKQMTLLEKAPTRVPGQNLLKAELPCMVPRQWENTGITFPCCSTCWDGCPRHKGSEFPLQGIQAVGKAGDGWKCQALLWEMHWEFSKMKQNCV